MEIHPRIKSELDKRIEDFRLQIEEYLKTQNIKVRVEEVRLKMNEVLL